jgi:hypothetical protein
VGNSEAKGFARLTEEELRAVSRKGGRASQASGNGYRWTPGELARQRAREGATARWGKEKRDA